MLQGLVIRQMFLLVDGAILVLVLVAAGYGALRAIGLEAGPMDPGPGTGTVSAPDMLAKVDSRAAYDAIVASRIFGLAGQVAQESAKEPEPAPAVEEVETKLKLKLCGTAATFPTDPLATAIIMNLDKNTMGTYFIGQDVAEQVTIEEIHQRKVVLFNKKANQREVLLAEENKGTMTVASASSSPSPNRASTPASTSASAPAAAGAPTRDRVTIKRSELVQELFVNYAEIAKTVKPEMYQDESGKVAGITASNLESIPLAKKLDVRNGDVLQTVNNEMIDSEQKVMDLIQKYQNATTLRVGLLRDGKPIVVTYRLE